MEEKKWTMYVPVVLVLVLAIPLVYSALYTDFQEERELAREVVGSDGIFRGFSEDTNTGITIIPDKVIDTTIPGSTTKVNVTDSSGNTTVVTQPTPRRSVFGGLLNALLLIGVAVLSAFGIFMLFKLRRRITLKMFFAFALGVCSSISVMLYLYLSRDMLEDVFGLRVPLAWPFYAVAVVVGFAIGTLIVRNMVFRSLERHRKNPALLAFCILLGPFLAIVLPVWVLIPLIAGVAIWDLWAAKRGIIKEMVHLSDSRRSEELGAAPAKKEEGAPAASPPGMGQRSRAVLKERLLSVDAGEDITSYGLYEGEHYSLGIGDFIFFAVLVSASFKWFMMKLPWMDFYITGWGEAIAILLSVLMMLMIVLGLKQTLGYLDREKVMPGLPLSVLWGLVTFIVSAVFLELVNVIFFGDIVNPF